MITRVMPIFIVLISLGLFFGYVQPMYSKEIVPLQGKIKQANSTLAAAKDFKQKEEELAKQRNAIPPESIQRLETYLPDGVDNVQLILDLNALAAKSGVQLSNFDIKSGATSDTPGGGELPLQAGNQKVDSLELSVKAVGTYNAFRTFLSGIEKSLRPMDLVQLNVQTSQTGVYSYDMTLRIYWLH